MSVIFVREPGVKGGDDVADTNGWTLERLVADLRRRGVPETELEAWGADWFATVSELVASDQATFGLVVYRFNRCEDMLVTFAEAVGYARMDHAEAKQHPMAMKG